MMNRISSRIGAAALAGLLAVVPVAGAVAAAPTAAASTIAITSSDDAVLAGAVNADVSDPSPTPGEDAPAAIELDPGFPWIFFISVAGGLAVGVAAMVILHRNDAREKQRRNR